MSSLPLRDYQADALAQLRQSLSTGHKRPVLQAPTGYGKTRLAAEIINLARSKGNRVTFSVPALSLIPQTQQAFWNEGIRDVGVIQADHPDTDWSKPVQIASVATLARRSFPKSDIVIIDECHKHFETYEKWMKHPDFSKVPFIGLSATPWTKGLGKHYDDLIISATTGSLIDQGYLSPFKVFAPSHPDLKDVRTVAGDYNQDDLATAMNKAVLVADVVETWIRQGEERPTLCFAVDRAHAKKLQDRFEAAGIRCGYLDAYSDLEEREAVRKEFTRGDIKVVCNVGVLTTGVDWDVRCIILARPTKSEMLFTQIIGRGLRTAPGKENCIARDTLILTDRGEVKIQEVTLDHKLWNGVEFVSHGGAICRGVQAVIEHDGIIGTPDHRVMTDDGWKSLSQAHRGDRRIVRTGIGRQPLRFFGDCVSGYRGKHFQFTGSRSLRALLENAYGSFSQYPKAFGDSGLSALQWAPAGLGPSLALSEVPSPTRSMSESKLSWVRQVWGAWNSIRVRESERGSDLDCGEFRGCRQNEADRSDRQQWPLCARKSSLGESGGEYEQHTGFGGTRKVHSFSSLVSRGSICGQDVAPSYFDDAGCRDCSAMGVALMQTKREVWDILNAGTLQRFTANGRLVHNCLILDHSDSHTRLGFVTDIHHDRLDDGRQKAKAEKKDGPLPKECPKCAYLRPVKVQICPNCGFKPEAKSNIEAVDGHLAELTRGKGTKATGPINTIKMQSAWVPLGEFYGMLKRHARERGYKPGYASNQYRDAVGAWPNAYSGVPEHPISYEVATWIKSRQIRFAKARAKADKPAADSGSATA